MANCWGPAGTPKIQKMQENAKNTYLFGSFLEVQKNIEYFQDFQKTSKKLPKERPKTAWYSKTSKVSHISRQKQDQYVSWTQGSQLAPAAGHMSNIDPFPGTKAKPFQK